MSLPRYIVNLEELSDKIINALSKEVVEASEIVGENFWEVGYDIPISNVDSVSTFEIPIKGDFSIIGVSYQNQGVQSQGDFWELYKGEEPIFEKLFLGESFKTKSFPIGIKGNSIEEYPFSIKYGNTNQLDKTFKISLVIKGEPIFNTVAVKCFDVDTQEIIREIQREVKKNIEEVVFNAPSIPNYYNVGLLKKKVDITNGLDDLSIHFSYKRKC